MSLLMSQAKELAHLWFRSGDASFDVKVYEYGMVKNTITVTDEELKEFHEMLAPAIRAIIAYKGQNMEEHAAPGHLVIQTMTVLQGRYFSLRDIDGKYRLLTGITDVECPGKAQSYVTARCIELALFEHESHEGTYVRSVCNEVFAVTRSELMRTFPDWLGRWGIGKGLGLNGSELMTYTFSNQENLPVVTMPDDVAEGPGQ